MRVCRLPKFAGKISLALYLSLSHSHSKHQILSVGGGQMNLGRGGLVNLGISEGFPDISVLCGLTTCLILSRNFETEMVFLSTFFRFQVPISDKRSTDKGWNKRAMKTCQVHLKPICGVVMCHSKIFMGFCPRQHRPTNTQHTTN